MPPMLLASEQAVKDVSGAWANFMGINIGDGLGLAEVYEGISSYGKVPADEAWVYACIRRLYSDAAGVPLKVFLKVPGGRLPLAPSDQRGADIQFLLDNVNDAMTGSDLKAYHIAADAIWGEDYWAKVRGRLGGPPQELHWLRAPDMTPNVVPGSNGVRDYTYKPNSSDAKVYKATDIIATHTVNLQDPHRGLSPISAIRYELSVNRQAAMQTAYTLANWGIPAGAWVAPKGADLSTNDQNAIRRALRALRGPKNSGKIPVLPEGLDWKQMAINAKDAEWIAARKVSRMAICAAFGIPLVLVGDDEKTTVYANLRDAERIYWRGTVIPKLDRFADSLNNFLLPDFGTDARRVYEIGFDYSEIEAFVAPMEDRQRAWTEMMDRTVVTPNEMRRNFRLGADVPWGDDPIRSTRLVQEPPNQLTATDPQQDSRVVEVFPGGQPDRAPVTPPAAAPAIHSITNLYRQPATKAWMDGGPLAPVADLLGVEATPQLEIGLRRRYTPKQLADGVPAEGYSGLTRTP